MARVGIPALLAIALAVTLVIAQPWRADSPARDTRDAAAARTPGHAPSAAPAPVRPAAAPRDGELGADDRLALTRPEPVDASGPVTLPTPIDIPSAVAAARAEAERLRGGAPTASMLADHSAAETPMRSDVAPIATMTDAMADGPEAGARFWFGPQGLIKLSTTGEGQR